MSRPTDTAPRSAGVWTLQFALAFVALNALWTFENRWPGFGIQPGWRLSFELCVLLALGIGWTAWRGRLGGWAVTLWALVFVLLGAVRYADVTAPAVLGRPINVYWDGRHGRELLRVAAASLSPGQAIAVGGAALGGLLLVTLLTRWAVATLARCLAWPPPRPLLLTAVALATLSFLAYMPGQRDTRWWFALPLTPTVLQQARLVGQALRPGDAEALLGRGPAFPALAASAPHPATTPAADVMLLFAESYGATSFDLPEVAAALAEPRAAFAQAVARSGRGMVSARVRSPTFGGGSWLAHAGLLSGLDMSDPGHYELLLTSRRPTLVSEFAQRGYRTVGWFPGLKKAWPEGRFYGYQRVVDDAHIGYGGPDFGYWRIPDQAAMALLTAQELSPGLDAGPRQPRFIVFPTTSTHAPFHPLAPFVDDWPALARSSAYTPAQAAAAMAAPLAVGAPRHDYIEGLRYQFRWLASYLEHRAPQRLVIVMLGDHQPPALVIGPGQPWDVPVHVISDDPALLQRLQAAGFAEGQQPPPTPLGPMHALTGVLLQALTADPAAGMSAAASEPLEPSEPSKPSGQPAPRH